MRDGRLRTLVYQALENIRHRLAEFFGDDGGCGATFIANIKRKWL